MAVIVSFAPASSTQSIIGLFILSPMAIWGAISLWGAATRTLPVGHITALGLVAGLLAMAGFRNFQFYMMILLVVPTPILELAGSPLVYGPQ